MLTRVVWSFSVLLVSTVEHQCYAYAYANDNVNDNQVTDGLSKFKAELEAINQEDSSNDINRSGGSNWNSLSQQNDQPSGFNRFGTHKMRGKGLEEFIKKTVS
jgi:hypothetical protein